MFYSSQVIFVKNESLLKDYFCLISHHPIDNAFHSLDFGTNIHNIHFPTPGECLHMHQLGIAKRQIEAFRYLIKGNVQDDHGPTSSKKKGSKDALAGITMLAQKYGGQLSRQLECNFPRIKFSCSILSVKRREAHNFAGMLLGLLQALLSDRGREIILID